MLHNRSVYRPSGQCVREAVRLRWNIQGFVRPRRLAFIVGDVSSIPPALIPSEEFPLLQLWLIIRWFTMRLLVCCLRLIQPAYKADQHSL